MTTAPLPLSHPASLDLRWLRWLITICVLLSAANISRSNDVALLIAAVANTAVGVLLCLYFGHLLLRRLQCSLLELLVIVAVLVNLEGLLLTSPGFMAFGWAWSSCLAAVAAGWILYGAVNSLAAARILGVTGSAQRVGLLAAHWLGAAAPALILLGALLVFAEPHGVYGDSQAWRAMIAPRMAAWGAPLLAAGVAGWLVCGWLDVKIGRAARAQLKSR